MQAVGTDVEIVVRLDAGLRESTLGAGAARAGGAPGPDGGGGGRVEVEGVGVDEPVGLGDVAAQADGELLARGAKGLDLALDVAGDSQVAVPVGHGGDLAGDAVGGLEGPVDHPQRAGAAGAGEVEAGGGLALGDIARAVGADEKERHALGARALEGG